MEKVKDIKNKIFDYLKLKDRFEVAKNEFNSDVDFKIRLNNLDIQSEDLDYYNDALIFNENWEFLFDSIKDYIEELNSKNLSDGMISYLTITKLRDKIKECMEYDPSINITFDEIIQLYDQYKLYNSCGFSELKKIDDDIQMLGKELEDGKDEFVEVSISKLLELGGKFSDIVSPYGESTKEQFNDVKIKTKSAVNKYSKKMLDFLSKIDEKTK